MPSDTDARVDDQEDAEVKQRAMMARDSLSAFDPRVKRRNRLLREAVQDLRKIESDDRFAGTEAIGIIRNTRKKVEEAMVDDE